MRQMRQVTLFFFNRESTGLFPDVPSRMESYSLVIHEVVERKKNFTTWDHHITWDPGSFDFRSLKGPMSRSSEMGRDGPPSVELRNLGDARNIVVIISQNDVQFIADSGYPMNQPMEWDGLTASAV